MENKVYYYRHDEKTSKLISDRLNGEYVKRFEYDLLLDRYRLMRKSLNIKDLHSQLFLFVNSLDLNSSDNFTVQNAFLNALLITKIVIDNKDKDTLINLNQSIHFPF